MVAHITLSTALTIYGCLFMWIAVTLAAIYAHAKYWACLKTDHAETWRSLGSPEMPDMRGSWGHKKFFDFTIFLRYRKIGDPKLKRLGDIANLLMVIQILTFFALAPFILGFFR